MIRHVIHVIDAVTGAQFEAPTGCDGYPHTCDAVHVPGRGLVLVTVWRETPPPIPDPLRTSKAAREIGRALDEMAAKKKKAKK